MSASNSPSSSNTMNSSTTILTPESIKSIKEEQKQRDKEKKLQRILDLEVELESLKVELGNSNPHEIVKTHIKLLHQYNEIKDGTQALIGKYAQLTGRTVREIHVEMGLPLVD